MMKWSKVADITFNNKLYTAVVRSDGFRFFLENKESNLYDYPLYEDYLKLYRNYCKSNYYSLLGDFSLDKLKVKFKSGKVIPLALATSIMLSTVSCKDNKKTYDVDQEKVYEVNTLPNDFTFEGMQLDPFYNNGNSFIIKSLDKDTLDYDKVSVPSEFLPLFSYNHYIVPSQAADYLVKKNVTKEDVIKLINDKQFDEFTKETLIDGLNNLDSKLIKINYDILYYNLYNLSIEYYEDLDLPDKSVNEGARFVPENHKLYLSNNYNNEDIYKMVLCHEILGHASTTVYIDEFNLYCTPRIPVVIFDELGNVEQVTYFGSSLDEGFTEIIASIASNKKIDCYKSGYGLQAYSFISYISMLGISLNDFAKGGVELVKNVSDEIDKDFTVNFINTLDAELSLQASNARFVTDYSDLFVDLYINATRYYEDLGYDQKFIQNQFNYSLEQYKNYVGLVFRGNGVSYVASYNDAGCEAIVNPKYISECVDFYLKNKDNRKK